MCDSFGLPTQDDMFMLLESFLTNLLHVVMLGTYMKELHKMVYLQNRHYLETSSEMRQDSVNFPDKENETHQAPNIRDYTKLKPYHKAHDNAPTK